MPPRRQQERPGHRAQARRGAGQEGGRREGRDRPGPGREVRPAAARAPPSRGASRRSAACARARTAWPSWSAGSPAAASACAAGPVAACSTSSARGPWRDAQGVRRPPGLRPGPSDRRRGEVHRARDTRGPRGLPGARARRGEAVRAGGRAGVTGARERAGATPERRASSPGERPRSGSRLRPRRGKMIPCHGIILHARRRGRRAGEVGAARRRVGAERPRHAGREETAHGRRRWHVPRAVSGFSVSLKINIVAPAGETLEIPGSDSARPRRVTASQGAAGAARGVGASRNAGFAADSAYAQDRPAHYRTVTISAFWSA